MLRLHYMLHFASTRTANIVHSIILFSWHFAFKDKVTFDCYIWMRQYCITMDIVPESTCHSLKKKNRCHMTPLPLHNGHFLLSPRWPMRRGLIVLQLSTNRVVFFEYGICGYFIPTIQSHSTLGWIERLYSHKFLLRSKMTFCIWIELCWLQCWITK